MSSAVFPKNEILRLQKLRSFQILDTLPEQIYDDITQMASEVCQAPIALITLVDESRQWFKSCVGLSVSETPRSISACTHAILYDDLLEIPDTTLDSRLKDSPLVTGEPFMRFYAGAPIITKEGFKLGTVCVLDIKPRELNTMQKDTLVRLARQVSHYLDQRRAQIDATLQERLLYSIVDNTDAVIFAKRMPSGEYMLVNNKWQSLFGMSNSDVLDRTDHQIFEKPVADAFHAADQKVFESQSELVLEELAPNKEGSLNSYVTSKFPLRNAAGSVYGVGGVASDVSAMKAIQKELQTLNGELSQFAYRVSHDLKAPVTGTRRLVKYILADMDTGNLEEAKSSCHKVMNLMDGLEVLLGDILSLVRADSHGGERGPIDFTTLVREISDRVMLITQDQKKNCKFISDLDDSLENIHFEKGRISQIIENLVSNGIKYSDSEKSDSFVSLKILKEEGLLKIVVTDNGVGIDKEFQDLVFNMFQRFHPDLSSGTGLGLYMVKKHVDFLSGQIQFVSSNDGTRFSVELPIKDRGD